MPDKTCRSQEQWCCLSISDRWFHQAFAARLSYFFIWHCCSWWILDLFRMKHGSDMFNHAAWTEQCHLCTKVNREQANLESWTSLPRKVMYPWNSIFIHHSIQVTLLDGWPLKEYVVRWLQNVGHNEPKIAKMQTTAKIKSALAVPTMYQNSSYKWNGLMNIQQ